MLFNSYGFIFLYFPLALAGLALCRKFEKNFPLAGFFVRKKQKISFRCGRGSLEKIYLFGVSLIFYGWRHPEYLPVLLGSMAVNYGLGWQLEGRGSGFGSQNRSLDSERGFASRTGVWGSGKRILAFGILMNLGLLGVFKYADTGGFVPLGISFFTFTQIAYLMECYRGSLKGVKALSYGLYVSFFPKMMQGPIVMPGELLPQFDDAPGSFAKRAEADWERIFRNLYLFILGLAKKVLLADTLGKAVDFGYGNLAALNSGDGLIVMLSYTLQLYFDFSGYCDMAMGIAGMMGFDLPLNFDSPYKASNILEFWKRWHITLTGFFTKYLYIPLGGSRKGRARTYLNCLIVFLLSGIWHGAGWQFVVWGLLHGALFVITRAWKDFRKTAGGENFNANRKADAQRGGRRGLTGVKSRAGHLFCVLLTFLYVNFAWIFFRASSVKEAAALLKTIAVFSFGKINWELAGCFNLDEFWYVIKILRLDNWQYAHYLLMVLFLAATLMIVFFGKSAVSLVRKAKPGALSLLAMTVLFIWSVVSLSGVRTFLYVNF